MFSDKGVDWSSDTIKAMLIGSFSWTGDEEYASEISSAEVSGTNYSRQTLGSKTETRSYPYITYDAADVTFSNITVTGVEHAVIIKDTGNDATSPIIARFDVRDGGSARNITNDDAVLQFSTDGVYQEEYR